MKTLLMGTLCLVLATKVWAYETVSQKVSGVAFLKAYSLAFRDDRLNDDFDPETINELGFIDYTQDQHANPWDLSLLCSFNFDNNALLLNKLFFSFDLTQEAGSMQYRMIYTLEEVGQFNLIDCWLKTDQQTLNMPFENEAFKDDAFWDIFAADVTAQEGADIVNAILRAKTLEWQITVTKDRADAADAKKETYTMTLTEENLNEFKANLYLLKSMQEVLTP